jgi:hypothetical protein
MWRRLLALAHPDWAGDHELFIWCSELHEHVAGDAIDLPRAAHERLRRRTTTDASPRLPFVEGAVPFGELTRRAVAKAADVEPAFGALLRLVDGCPEAPHGPLHKQQRQGATYRRSPP